MAGLIGVLGGGFWAFSKITKGSRRRAPIELADHSPNDQAVPLDIPPTKLTELWLPREALK